MLLWQNARFQSPASSKFNITICDSTRQNTWSFLRHNASPPLLSRLFNIFSCILRPRAATNIEFWRSRLEPSMSPQQHQNVHHLVNSVRCNIPVKFQKHCFIIGRDIHNFVSHHCTCPTDDVINDQICIKGKPEYLWNKKRYHKKKNTISLHFEKPPKWAYPLNDPFFWSRALSRFQCPDWLAFHFNFIMLKVMWGNWMHSSILAACSYPPGASVICLFSKSPSHAFQTRYCSGFTPVVLCRLFFEVQTEITTSILSYSNNMLIPCAWSTKAIIIFHELTLFFQHFFINDYEKTALQIFFLLCKDVLW